MGVFLTVLLLIGSPGVFSQSASPLPELEACAALRPEGGPSSGSGSYLISTDIPANSAQTGYDYAAGRTYIVTLTTTGQPFRGFAIQALSVPGGTGVGTFLANATSHQLIYNCGDGLQNTVIHNNPQQIGFTSQTFTWVAPDSAGTVNFMYAVVQQNSSFWIHSSAIAEDFVTSPPTPSAPATAGPIQVPIPPGVSTPKNNPEDYPLFFTDPQGCSPSECLTFVGIERNEGNPDYLNFYLEGATTTWVAVGFSDTPNMFSTNVIACNMNPTTGKVEILDSWNLAPNKRNSIPEKVQMSYLFSSTSQNGRISCSFGRSIAGNGTTSMNLDEDHYVLYGLSKHKPSLPELLVTHVTQDNKHPQVSKVMVNVANDTGGKEADPFEEIKDKLIRAHGILMLIAWPLLATTAIFFAAWMRPALPNGEWFQVHRALMLLSLFLASVGFVLIFVSQLHGSPPGLVNFSKKDETAHLFIGIVVMLLQIVNPIIAIFRCHPGEKHRWIFNIVHGIPGIGFAAEILALSNAALGIYIFSSHHYSREYSHSTDLTVFWFYIAYLAFILLQLILFVVPKYSLWYHSGEKSYQIINESSTVKRKKQPSSDSVYRWIGLAVFLIISVLAILGLSVLIAWPSA